MHHRFRSVQQTIWKGVSMDHPHLLALVNPATHTSLVADTRTDGLNLQIGVVWWLLQAALLITVPRARAYVQ